MSTVAPLAAAPWAAPVCPPFGTDVRDRSVFSSRRSYVAGGSTTGIAAANNSAANHTAIGAAVAKQDRPPRGEPR
jgi:hypothetical protein